MRDGVVPGSHPIIGGRLTGEPWSQLFRCHTLGKAASINQAQESGTQRPASNPDCLDLHLIFPSVLIGHFASGTITPVHLESVLRTPRSSGDDMAARKTGTEPKTKADQNRSKHPLDASDDEAIYLPIDGIRASAPWRLNSYGDEGALSASDKAALAERFSLPGSATETLSKQLGYCLDIASEVTLVEINRAKAIKRAKEPLEEAARLARRIESDIHKIVQHMEGLSDQFKQHEEDGDALRSAKEQAQAVMRASIGLENAIDLLIKTPGSAADMSPLNKNHIWDKRRQYVIETCCYTWQDSGHRLTYTNVSDGSKPDRHAGPLIDFIQEIVLLVTEPAKKLSTNTIKKDIDRFKKKLDEPDELSLPPTEG